MTGGDRGRAPVSGRYSLSPSDHDTKAHQRETRPRSRGKSFDRDRRISGYRTREKQASASRTRTVNRQGGSEREQWTSKWNNIDRQRSPKRCEQQTRRSASPGNPRMYHKRDYSDDDRSPKRRRNKPDRSLSPIRRRRGHQTDPKQHDQGCMSHRDGRGKSTSHRRFSGSRNEKELDDQESRDRGRSGHINHDKDSHRRVSSKSPSRTDGRAIRSNVPLPTQDQAFNKDSSTDSTLAKTVEKQLPSLAPTGALAKETNTVAGTSIILKYNEPPESRLPPASSPWRLFIFKDSSIVITLNLYQRSCWLFGRERAVVDHLIEHPSCSKQHAVLQFRWVEKRNEYGERKGGVRPYVIDLDSANGTTVNGDKIPERRYVEVRSNDVLKFGESTREYVLILPPKD